MNIEVFVTTNDIKRGKRSHCDICPVAIATDRALNAAGETDYSPTIGGVKMVLILKEGRRKTKKPAIRIVSMPQIARTAIHNFDKGRSMQPFTFTFSL